MGIRARNESEKCARREAIVAVVTQSLVNRPLTGGTMAEIAARCGLAKGTLYLYYETKEELFLATLESELTAWYAAIAEALAQEEGLIDARRYAEIVVQTLVVRGALVDLLPQLRACLEQAMPTKTATRFRNHVRAQMEALATAIEPAMGLAAGAGLRVLVRTQALVAGLPHVLHGEPASAPSDVPIRSALRRELRSSITALVRGMVDLAE